MHRTTIISHRMPGSEFRTLICYNIQLVLASPIYAHVEQSRFSGGIGHNRTRKSLDFYSAKLLQIYYLKGYLEASGIGPS